MRYDNILDGQLLSRHLLEQLKLSTQMYANGCRPPHLTILQVGSQTASTIYIQHKIKAIKTLQFQHTLVKLEPNITNTSLRDLVATCNEDPTTDGILIQLPLPKHIDQLTVLNSIDPLMDVDGLHPLTTGKHFHQIPTPYMSCTTQGILWLLNAYNIQLKSKHVVILNDSNLVGKPCLAMALEQGATVTVCHKHTNNLQVHVEQADLLISAIGQSGIVQPSWLKDQSILIDVGIQRRGNSVIGDVMIDDIKERLTYYTPVPGGVGPMTIAALMINLATSWSNQHHLNFKKDDFINQHLKTFNTKRG
ncbi:bifunctional 5,10-methylenetetrahydrofolate dehydrogenase/5,10-methenyltetrahydrofolate cyclohydrolase [Gammaproteobacteria bacterium]|nr:bifunctional 5,10-methylenetetrahydrofolate dehydrogenase/5,10-methenyltetrahydrofolate cyclohydrolase [Gammaproteobacteria bacterium]